jgi:hypothetical protein
MSNALSKDFNEEGQGLDDLDRLLLIIDAIPQDSGLKRDDGVLKRTYPDDKDADRIFARPLVHDVCQMAHISGCSFTVFHVREGSSEYFSFNFEELLEKVRQIKPEMAGQQMRQICREVYNAYEKANSRLTDSEEFEIYLRSNDIEKAYVDHLREKGLQSPFPSIEETFDAIEEKMLRRLALIVS